MAIVDFPEVVIPCPLAYSSMPPAFTTITLNATADKVAFILQIPKSGTLDHFEWRTGTVGNNPDNGMKLSFQDVDPATGLPDGVVDQFVDMTGTFVSNTWQIPATVMTDTGLSGGVKRAVTRGQYVACVIEFVSFVALDSIIVIQSTMDTVGVFNKLTAYVADGNTGTYVKSAAGAPTIALKYSDGTYAMVPGIILGMVTSNVRAYNNSTTPDERALRFKVPIACRLTGFWAYITNGFAMDVILYDSADNILTSVSLDPDIQSQTGEQPVQMKFPVDVDLSTSETYRLSFLPTSASSISVYDFDVNVNAILSGIPGGIQWYSSSRVNAGVWTDVDNNRPFAGLIINGFDTAGGGGGAGEHSFVSLG